jgi:hypothetical protein
VPRLLVSAVTPDEATWHSAMLRQEKESILTVVILTDVEQF